MDAVKYLIERDRMKKAIHCPPECKGDYCDGNCSLYSKGYSYEQSVTAVEKWSNEHPAITNADKFLEVFGHEIRCSRFLDRDGRAFVIDRDNVGHVVTENWLYEEYKEPDNENEHI